MANQIEVYSAEYDKVGRISFSWSRLKNTKYTTYWVDVNGIGMYRGFALSDIAAATSIVPCDLLPGMTYTLSISAGDDEDGDPGTTGQKTISGN